MSGLFALALFGFGLYALIVLGGGAISLFLGAWISHQTYLLHKAKKDKLLETHPIFFEPLPAAAVEHPSAGGDHYLASLEGGGKV